ncbi:MAG: LptF/LptG family permease [Litoreibacter sp.]
MHTLTRYLSLLFLTRNLMISFGMVAILAVLDALSKGEILPLDADLKDHLWFMLLRAPLIFEQIFVFAFLLSLLVTYVTLIRRNELVSIVAGGLSAMRQIWALVPAVLIASVSYTVLIDQAAPRAQQSLMTWIGPEAVIRDTASSNNLWVADGSTLVRIKSVNEGGLVDLTIFEREGKGRLASVNLAKAAQPEGAGWRLTGVRQLRFDSKDADPPELWSSTLDSQMLRLLTLEPRYLSITDLWDLSKLRGAGNRSAKIYQMWIYNRLALPISALGFMILTVFAMQRFGRDPRPEVALVVAMAAGFLYVIVDSLTKTLPEKTSVTAFTAAFAPLACLLVVCVILAVRNARV